MDLRRVAPLRPIAVTLWRGDGVGVDVRRWLAKWEVTRSACAPMPVANKTRTTTAQTSRFIRLSPLTVFGPVLSHTALNLVIHVEGELSSPCGNAWSMSSIPVGRRDPKRQAHAEAGAPWAQGAPAALSRRYAGPYVRCKDSAMAVLETVKWSHMPAAAI